MSGASFDYTVADFNYIEHADGPQRLRLYTPVGTGPFKFVEYKGNQSIKLTRNPNYWKPGLPYLDGIEYTIIPNRSTAILGFVSGNFDMIFPYELTVALVADDVVAKLGFFKGLWVLILGAKKFLMIGIAAVAAWWRDRAMDAVVPGSGYPASFSRWCGSAQSSTGPAGTIRCGLRCGWVV